MGFLEEKESKAGFIFPPSLKCKLPGCGWGRGNHRILEMEWPLLTFIFSHTSTLTDEEIENQKYQMTGP